MADTKISAGADPGTLLATDKVPIARSGSTTAYSAAMAELATYANGAYVPSYFGGAPSMDGTAAPGTSALVGRGDHVHPTDTTRYAASNPSGYQTAAQVAAAVAPYANDVGRNLIHNPTFNVAQRGAGPWTGTGYTVDRWTLYINLDTASVVQTPVAPGTMTLDEACAFMMVPTVTGNAGAAAQTIFYQNIEDVRRLGSKTVTVSFYALAYSAGLKVGVSLDQVFGTGGSPSAAVYGNGQSVTLTATWARYSLTFTVPSVVGKTLGTNGDSKTGLNIWLSSGASNAVRAGNIGVQSGTAQLWGVQLEVGSVATPLEKIDPGLDLRNCQRFYLTFAMSLAAIATAAGQTFGYNVVLPVTMRATPAAAAASNSSTNLGTITFYPAPGTLAAVAASSAAGAININLIATASADL